MDGKSSQTASAKTMHLVGQVVELLRSDGALAGDRLYEHRLAQRLGTSRGPVRAALTVLVDEGIAQVVPNKGFLLKTGLDSEIIRKILEESQGSEAIYRAIANDRFEGHLPDLVSEAEMMRRYDLPRGALLRLLDQIAAEGWVERQKGYGWKFTQTLTSPHAYAQTGRLRMMIEPGGIMEPTFFWDRERMSVVREHQERVLKDGLRVFTLAEMFRFGCELHEGIAECSGNLFLLESLRRINRVRRLFAYRFIPDLGLIERHTREHLKLLDLLERGDRVAAAALMREHLWWSAGANQLDGAQ